MDSTPEEVVDDLKLAHTCLERCVLLLEAFVGGRWFEVAVVQGGCGAGRGMPKVHGRQGGRLAGDMVGQGGMIEHVLRGDIWVMMHGRCCCTRDWGVGTVGFAGRCLVRYTSMIAMMRRWSASF